MRTWTLLVVTQTFCNDYYYNNPAITNPEIFHVTGDLASTIEYEVKYIEKYFKKGERAICKDIKGKLTCRGADCMSKTSQTNRNYLNEWLKY